MVKPQSTAMASKEVTHCEERKEEKRAGNTGQYELYGEFNTTGNLAEPQY